MHRIFGDWHIHVYVLVEYAGLLFMHRNVTYYVSQIFCCKRDIQRVDVHM